MRALILALLLLAWRPARAQAPADVFAPDDSLLVRRILDLNGKQDVPVDSVVMRSADGRFATFRLAGLGIASLPPEIGKLSFNNLFAQKNNLAGLPPEVNDIFPLRNVILDSNRFESFPGRFDRVNEVYMISLRHNRLKAVTAEDVRRAAIKKLVTLRLDYNQIDTISPELARVNILGMYLGHNRLSGLPVELAGTSPGTLDVDYNRLCAVPDTLAAWISKHSVNKDWRSTQDCSTSVPRNRSGRADAPSAPPEAKTCFSSLGSLFRTGARHAFFLHCR